MPDLCGMSPPVDASAHSTSTETEEARRQALEDRLRIRDAERLSALEAKRVARAETSAENESLDFFARRFNAEVEAIARDLAAASENRVDKADLPAHFDNVNDTIQKLTKYLADSKLFLPTYELRKSQEKIDALNESLTKIKNELVPKKKFGFKNKSKATTTSRAGKGDSPGIGSRLSSGSANSTIAEPEVEDSVSQLPDEGDHVIADKTKEVVAATADVDNRVIGLFRLEDCDVLLRGSPSAVHVRNLRRCRVFAGPVSGSVFIDRCDDCVFVLACQQLRIHSTHDTGFYIHVTSKAIVEDCGRVSFAPYNLDYVGLDADYVTSGLDRTRNNWSQIDDFNFLAAETASPNWRLLAEEERISSWTKNVEKMMNSKKGAGEEL